MRIKQEEENRRLKELKEIKRKRDLKNSCQPSKVRTYACNDDGYRVIKYFDYVYDFEEDMCVEKVKKRTIKCSAYDKEHEAEEEEGRHRSHSKSRHSRRGHNDDSEAEDDEELPKKYKGDKRSSAEQYIQKNSTKANLAQVVKPAEEDEETMQAKIDNEE